MVAGCALALNAQATEGGATNKIPGVDTVLVGVMGPPGSLRNTNFFGYYQASSTLDGSGNPRQGLSNFDLTAWAFTVRLQYVWPEAKFLGADVESRLGLSAYGDVRVHFDVQTPRGAVQRSGSSSEVAPGAIVAPTLFGWHGETVHQVAGPEIFLSTHAYDPAALANASTGFNSIAPAYWITWLPDPRVELDGSFVYLFNQKNSKTHYTSGNELNVDYGAGYAVSPVWQAGVSGYLYKQTTDDELNGTGVPGGNRGRALAIGPYVRYHPSRDFGVTLKWQSESGVENRAKGNRFFLQVAIGGL